MNINRVTLQRNKEFMFSFIYVFFMCNLKKRLLPKLHLHLHLQNLACYKTGFQLFIYLFFFFFQDELEARKSLKAFFLQPKV